MSLKFKPRKYFSSIPLFIGVLFFIFCLGNVTLVFADFDVKDLFHKRAQYEEALVLKVIASDTVILENGQRIKLLGVDSFGPPPRTTIEYDDKGRPLEKEVEPTIPLEEQAIAYAQNLMEGKKVKLEFDLESRDDRGNKVAYIYLTDGTLVNVELLRQGFVKLQIRPPNIKHADLLKKAYQEARREQRGFLSD